MSDVDNFLRRFHSSNDIDEVFTSGCCYWFSQILYRRFIRDGATVMYDSIANHFGTKIKGKVYDITGDVTSQYEWKPWLEFDDPLERVRVVSDRIMF